MNLIDAKVIEVIEPPYKTCFKEEYMQYATKFRAIDMGKEFIRTEFSDSKEELEKKFSVGMKFLT